MAREKSGIGGKISTDQARAEFSGGNVLFGDVTKLESLTEALKGHPVDVVVSCLASRTGGKKVRKIPARDLNSLNCLFTFGSTLKSGFLAN